MLITCGACTPCVLGWLDSLLQAAYPKSRSGLGMDYTYGAHPARSLAVSGSLDARWRDSRIGRRQEFARRRER
jgi:hypothetical protein